MRRKACDGNEESHDLGSKRSAKFVCEETRDRNAASPFLRTRDHRIGKSSSAVSCNYGQSRSRAFLACIYTRIYVYSHRVSGNHHPSFFPLLYPPSVPQSRSLCRTRVRAGLAACGSHFGARSPGVERYRSVPDRKATGFSLRLIRSFSWFRLFTLLVLLVISLPAINVVRGTSTRINRDSRAESLECIYKFRVDSNGRNSSKMKYR